jgi:hypothetical protein
MNPNGNIIYHIEFGRNRKTTMVKKARTVIASLELGDLSLVVVWIFFCIFIISLSLDQARWVLHPDDWDGFIFPQVFFQTGQMYYNAPLNLEYNVTAFWQPLSYLDQGTLLDASVGSKRSPGYFILLSLGVPFGYHGILAVHCVISAIGLLFIGLTSREFFGSWGGVISMIVMGINPSFIFWTQLLLNNTVAVAFFFGGVFLLARSMKKRNNWTYSLSGFLLAMSFWIRYDYIWPIGFIVVFMFMQYGRTNYKKIVPFLTTLALTMLITIAVNLTITGNFAGTFASNGSETPEEMFFFYLIRLFDPVVLFTNLGQYFVNLIPLTLCLAVVGIAIAHQRRKENPLYLLFVLLLVVCAFTLYYYGKNPDFWGYGHNWLAASYTRYFMIPFAVVSISCGASAEILKLEVPWRNTAVEGRKFDGATKKSSQKMTNSRMLGIPLANPNLTRKRIMAYLVMMAILAGQMAITYNILTNCRFGLQYVARYTDERREFDLYLQSLSPNGVFVDTTNAHYYKNMICSVTVLAAYDIGNETTLEIVVDMLGNGLEVFLITSQRTTVLLNESLNVSGYELVRENSPVFGLIDNPEIYQISSI